MKARSERLERAFRAIDELLEESPSAPSKRVEQPAAVDERVLETACTCGKYSFPHIHGREDRRKAIENRNRHSQHKIAEWIQ